MCLSVIHWEMGTQAKHFLKISHFTTNLPNVGFKRRGVRIEEAVRSALKRVRLS